MTVFNFSRTTVDYYLDLLEKKDRSPDEKHILNKLFIKILNYNRWYQVVKMFGLETLKNEMVVDDVIRGLFPRPLRKNTSMLKKSYKKLYDLQDEALGYIRELNTPFYLTGETALSRFFLHHRYSDDLDLFVNFHPDFEVIARDLLKGDDNTLCRK